MRPVNVGKYSNAIELEGCVPDSKIRLKKKVVQWMNVHPDGCMEIGIFPQIAVAVWFLLQV